jgi:signal transduction histidine kinase
MEVLLVIGLSTMLFASRLRSLSYLALLVGFFLMAASDLLYAVLILKGQYAAGDWIDYGWIASYGILGVAAFHPSLPRFAEVIPQRRGALGKGRLAIIGVALGVAPLLAVGYDLADRKGIMLEIPIASIIAITLVLLRVSHLWRERQGAETALRESESSYRDLYSLAESAREQVTAQNRQLLELDKMKDEFVALISHDLRTPLTSIIAGGAALSSPTTTSDEREELSAAVVSEGERLSRLVENLLDMSRLEAGKAQPHSEPVDLAEVLEAARAAIGRPEVVRLAIDAELPLVDADAAQLERAFANLLENAVRHGGGRPVLVKSMLLDGKITLRVVDQGPGIPESERRRIFEPFQHGEGGSGGGAGLGLAIARGFVEANGGEITVDSVVGQGSSFVVAMPCGKGG